MDGQLEPSLLSRLLPQAGMHFLHVKRLPTYLPLSPLSAIHDHPALPAICCYLEPRQCHQHVCDATSDRLSWHSGSRDPRLQLGIYQRLDSFARRNLGVRSKYLYSRKREPEETTYIVTSTPMAASLASLDAGNARLQDNSLRIHWESLRR